MIYYENQNLRRDIHGEALLRIGQVAEMSGLSLRTIDYYTRNGLLAYRRSPSNYRLYDVGVLETIKRIKLLKEQRFSLEEIKTMFETKGKRDIEKVLDDVQEEIHSLEKKLFLLEESMVDASHEERRLVSQKIGNQLAVLMQLATLL